jgi:hypothetical protein
LAERIGRDTKPDSLARLRFDVAFARILVWIASVGRDGELTGNADLYFADRYERLAACYRRRGNGTRVARCDAKAREHLRHGGWDGPPYAAAMGMPRPKRWIMTDAVSHRQVGGPRDAA